MDATITTGFRVVPDLFAETGDPSGTGKSTPGYYVNTEILPSLRFVIPGMAGMAKSRPNTGNGQFLITLAPIEKFDGRYTIFGQVLSGAPSDPLPSVEAPLGDK